MKIKIITLMCLSSITFSTLAQNSHYLQHNNVKALINSDGIFFTNEAINQPAYLVPKNGSTHSIFASTFWFGGYDNSMNLHLCAQKYNNILDFYSGPIASNYNDPSYITTLTDKIWSVTSNQINTHLQNYNTPNYVVPIDISSWPAHGNVSNGEAQNLAPFVDLNNNGIYDPINGDYPNIRGESATYFIVNDSAGIHNSSFGEILGMEFHFMTYQYATNDNINNTTFINLKVINRSSNVYNDFKVAQFVDADLGYSNDDYYGCDTVKQIIYTYNADNIDEANGGSPGFGTPPPAIGVKLLNQHMDVTGFFSSTSSGVQNSPTIAQQYWGYMNAEWGSSGMHFTRGGTGIGGSTNTNYLMYSNPNETLGWSEYVEALTPGDRRMYMVSKGQTIAPNEYICYDFAIISAQGNTNLNSVDSLYSVADEIQTFYDNQTIYTCESVVLGVKNNKNINDISIYPNPNHGEFTITNINGIKTISIYTITGQEIKTIEVNNQTLLNIDLSNLEKGIYLVKYKSNNSFNVKKITIN